MSFAATLALVATYERGLPWMIAGANTSLGARIALWGGREVAALILASMVAGLATTLYAAYHFHRLAPYGVIANLFGMPVISVVSMPAGLLALVAMPFGFDAALWQLMGKGIDWMIAVALWVTSLPGAVGRVTAFGAGPVLLGTAGLVLVCLLRSPLRWTGVLALAGMVAIAMRTPQPDIYVSSTGEAMAVRGESGQLSIMRTGSDTFAVREWLTADADPRTTGDPGLRAGAACDPTGCVAPLADGAVVALALTPEAFDDDCARAALIVSRHAPPPDCAARVFDRAALQRSGAVALRRVGEQWQVTVARQDGRRRPWMRPESPSPATGPAVSSASRSRSAAPDATPRPDDLEPGD